jgi:hypothetical protein
MGFGLNMNCHCHLPVNTMQKDKFRFLIGSPQLASQVLTSMSFHELI